jgi:hypothetical protein
MQLSLRTLVSRAFDAADWVITRTLGIATTITASLHWFHLARLSYDQCEPVDPILPGRAVLRHSIDTCRDVHRHHPDQTASENLQGRMATRRAVEVIPDDEQQYPRNKDADHVYVEP